MVMQTISSLWECRDKPLFSENMAVLFLWCLSQNIVKSLYEDQKGLWGQHAIQQLSQNDQETSTAWQQDPQFIS